MKRINIRHLQFSVQIQYRSMVVRQKFKVNGVPDKSGRYRRSPMNSSFDIYEMVTNLIIERLEKGVVPFSLDEFLHNLKR